MRALGLLGSLAIGCLVVLGGSCGDDDDNKGDGGTGGGGTQFACDYANYGGGGSHWCWTWDASNVPGASASAVIGAYQSACTQGMGTAVSACSTSGAVGKCTFTSTSGTYTVSQTIFYYSPITPQVGMQACMANNAGGVTATWTPL